MIRYAKCFEQWHMVSTGMFPKQQKIQVEMDEMLKNYENQPFCLILLKKRYIPEKVAFMYFFKKMINVEKFYAG